MTFLDILNDSVTKERGGRHGGKGHEFQRYWALCHLLQVDLDKDDYLLLLEFIEDVALLNNGDVPAEMELFQLKKKEGTSPKWTKTTIAKPPKDGKSILAKLHESKAIAKNETTAISFVSNAPIDLKLSDGSDPTRLSEFSAGQIDSSLLSELKTSVASELGCKAEDVDFDNLKFLRSSLAMDDLESHATGRVASFLASKFPDHSPRADVLCKAIYSEIKVKATSTEEAATFHDLKRIRGISKHQFSSMVALTLSRKSDSDVVDGILANLIQESVPYVQREAIKRAARRFIVEKAGRGSSLLSLLQGHVENTLLSVPNNLITSWDVANWVVDQVLALSSGADFSILDRDYMIAAALYWMSQ
ncbi:DUF4297 domain-containing protein [Comamonas sp. wu1-DMT]|uniref:DUF4297 domain-containing protein n=1 Tax=Comamonas sp. wu1-DMT TaxID=3126390 RepID=UPI0032E4A953